MSGYSIIADRLKIHSEKAFPNPLNQKNQNNETPLILAAKYGHAEIAFSCFRGRSRQGGAFPQSFPF